MAKRTILNTVTEQAIVSCLEQAIAGLGIADDGDEWIDSNLEENSLAEVRKQCEEWDLAIAFHNAHCAKNSKFSDPWMVNTLEMILKENAQKK